MSFESVGRVVERTQPERMPPEMDALHIASANDDRGHDAPDRIEVADDV